MKNLLSALLLAGFTLGALGQGEIYLNNYVPGTVDARVSRPDGTGAGAGVNAELMLVQPGDTLTPLGPATTFRTESAATAYYVNPIVITVPGILPGAVVLVRLVAFDGTDFATSNLKGESNDISVTLGGGIILPPNLAGLQGFTLTADGTAPTITQDPQSQTVAVGTPVKVSVAAAGPGTLSYQWQKNGKDLSGATDTTFSLSSALETDSGQYQAIVHNTFGSATSKVAMITVLAPPHVTQPPSNLSVVSGSPAAFSVQASGAALKYKWQHNGTDIPGATGPSLKLAHAASGDAGDYKVIISNPVGQDTATASLKIDQPPTNITLHPADKDPADQRLTEAEATAYAAAWKQGSTWASGPNPIPASYVSRAGTLWKSGEAYTVDTKIAAQPPLWWVSTSTVPHPGPRSHDEQGSNENGGSSSGQGESDSGETSDAPVSAIVPDKYVPGIAGDIHVAVRPPAGTLSYVVEVDVPKGWTVSNISDDGAFDASASQVKWGLFTDDQKRELTFQLVPPADSTAPFEVTGLASFDGSDLPLAAGKASVASSKMGHPHRGKNGHFNLDVTGAIGQTFAIEVSTDLVHWTQIKTFQNLNGLLGFEDSNSALLGQKFFRAVIVP